MNTSRFWGIIPFIPNQQARTYPSTLGRSLFFMFLDHPQWVQAIWSLGPPETPERLQAQGAPIAPTDCGPLLTDCMDPGPHITYCRACTTDYKRPNMAKNAKKSNKKLEFAIEWPGPYLAQCQPVTKNTA
ncbi:hypothetical protein O181_094112 [Austropuccinia psidii MF-1]|uniref:Uncharacterized protein n=1 Tax=Austropuccinia psidii MF-1 TaxID=1389203 RepID=A0A9Q3J2B5_9BASI|nr:hypothetical protein [Austropuccinia psidii MF-1]